MNSDKEFDPQPKVYAVLTDLRSFLFLSFDGETFCVDEEIIVSDKTRPCFLKGMADGRHSFCESDIWILILWIVADRLFSMILEGYFNPAGSC